jgi:phytanoyl-CoA hydroxylase
VFQEAKEDFDRDGFTVVQRFLTGKMKQALLDNVDRYLQDVVPAMDLKQVFFEDKSRPETLIYVQNMQLHDPYFRTMLKNGACRQLAELLLGQPAAPQGISIFNKPPRIGRGTPPHQDAYYWMLEPNEALTLWVAIDRSDEANGCVRYIPGSHKLDMRPHEATKAFGFSQRISDYSAADEQAELPVPIEPGDLIAHHGMTIHRTDDNTSDRSRRAVGLVYYSQRAKVDTELREKYTKKLKQEWAEAGRL